MLDIKDLRLIQALYDHKTLTRAARALNQKQPALSRQLLTLESKIGGALFTRKKDGSVPTNLGRSIIEMGSLVLTHIDKMHSTIEELRGRQKSDISVVSGFRVTETFLAQACSKAISDMPEIRIRLKSAEWSEIEKEVLERKAFIGLVHLPGHSFDASLRVEALDAHPSLFFVRKGHPLTLRATLTLEDVLTFPFISAADVPPDELRPVGNARSQLENAEEVHPAFPSMVHSSLTFGFKVVRNSDAVMSSTVGAALSELREGGLSHLPLPSFPWMALRPGIITLKTRPFSPYENLLIDIIRDANTKARKEAISWCSDNGIHVF